MSTHYFPVYVASQFPCKVNTNYYYYFWITTHKVRISMMSFLACSTNIFFLFVRPNICEVQMTGSKIRIDYFKSQ